MWVISLFILLIFLWLKDRYDRDVGECEVWMLRQYDRCEKLVRTGVDPFSKDYVDRMHRQFRYDYDPWYPDWMEKGIITWKRKNGCNSWEKCESEKEVEYWTQKMKLPKPEFERWLEKQWENRLELCIENSQIVEIDEKKRKRTYYNAPLYYVEKSEFAPEYIFEFDHKVH